MGVAWKELEREVARRLDGSRVIREQWDKRDCDIRHAVYSIECKFRKDIGVWYNDLLKEMRYKGQSFDAERAPSDFVIEALEQARGYCATKPAVAVLKKKSMEYDDALVFMRVEEFPLGSVKHVKLLKKRMVAFTGLKEFTEYWNRYKYRMLPEPIRYEG